MDPKRDLDLSATGEHLNVYVDMNHFGGFWYVAERFFVATAVFVVFLRRTEESRRHTPDDTWDSTNACGAHAHGLHWPALALFRGDTFRRTKATGS